METRIRNIEDDITDYKDDNNRRHHKHGIDMYEIKKDIFKNVKSIENLQK